MSITGSILIAYPIIKEFEYFGWDTSFLIQFSKTQVLTDSEYSLLRKDTLVRQIFTSGYNHLGSQPEDHRNRNHFLHQCFLIQYILSKHVLTYMVCDPFLTVHWDGSGKKNNQIWLFLKIDPRQKKNKCNDLKLHWIVIELSLNCH